MNVTRSRTFESRETDGRRDSTGTPQLRRPQPAWEGPRARTCAPARCRRRRGRAGASAARGMAGDHDHRRSTRTRATRQRPDLCSAPLAEAIPCLCRAETRRAPDRRVPARTKPREPLASVSRNAKAIYISHEPSSRRATRTAVPRRSLPTGRGSIAQLGSPQPGGIARGRADGAADSQGGAVRQRPVIGSCLPSPVCILPQLTPIRKCPQTPELGRLLVPTCVTHAGQERFLATSILIGPEKWRGCVSGGWEGAGAGEACLRKQAAAQASRVDEETSPTPPPTLPSGVPVANV